MSESSEHGADGAIAEVSFKKTLWTLELLDSIAHVLVAVFFILMACSVLIYAGIKFVREIPLIGEALHGSGPGGEHAAGATQSSPFLHSSLELLSSVLFVVIVLELLKTIITYLQSHDIYAIMKEFIVVGIISSVRKILLVGAESSLAGDKGWEFVKEAGGTVISIVGILLLIYGLLLLQKSRPDTVRKPESPVD